MAAPSAATVAAASSLARRAATSASSSVARTSLLLSSSSQRLATASPSRSPQPFIFLLAAPSNRSYATSRDPLQAEHEANTVRGNRAARLARERAFSSGSTGSSSSGSSSNPNGSGSGSGPNKPGSDGKGSSYFGRLGDAWKKTPIIWYPIPILLGAVVLVGIQARRNYVSDQRGQGRGKAKIVDENGAVVSMKGPWTVYVLGALPLNAISRAWGWANNLTLPVWFRPYGFRLYAYIFGCNLDEMKDPDLTHYRSLGEFFYRELKDGIRPVHEAPLVSPADGKVLHFGSIQGRRVEQVKGITYSLDALLGMTSDPQGIDSVTAAAAAGASSAKTDKPDQIMDEKHFASVNGIEYSLDRLLGEEEPSRKERRRRWRVASWDWWKSWVVQGKKGITGLPGSLRGSTSKDQARTVQRSDDDEEADAAVPTDDSPETIGRYANVAYDMGSGAFPPILQRNSPGHDGVAEGNKLFFCVIYLAPGDYHRFHSPTSWVIERRRHFRGELYSVSPYIAHRLENYMVLNERLALFGRWRWGSFAFVPVGATNVGSITLNFDTKLRTNSREDRGLAGTYSEASYASASRLLGGMPMLKGQEMGGFHLGSTIVLIVEAPEGFEWSLTPGQKIRVGEPLGDLGGVEGFPKVTEEAESKTK